MRLTTLLLLILPGCSSLGIPTPWPSGEEVAQGDAQAVAEADRRAAERVTAHEAGDAPAPPLEAPEPPPTGLGWTELLLAVGGGLLLRGIPSKGPLLALWNAGKAAGKTAIAALGKPPAPPVA